MSVLATSRERLRIPGEQLYRVPSLDAPPAHAVSSAEEALKYEAIELFVQRARAVSPDFRLADAEASALADICRRLDGIALAIELAASRVKVLSVAQLAHRIESRFQLLVGGSRTSLPRQQTLHALIDWSYDLLTPDERRFLCRLAVFRGAWSPEAAACVGTDRPESHENAFELLTALVDKSLVVVDDEGHEKRFRLLESTREYALGRRDEDATRDAARGRHCGYFARLAELRYETRWLSNLDTWFAAIGDDLANYREALEWGLERRNDVETAAVIAAALGEFWLESSYRSEGEKWLALTRECLFEPPADYTADER